MRNVDYVQETKVDQVCKNCGMKIGEYSKNICIHCGYDNNEEKKQQDQKSKRTARILEIILLLLMLGIFLYFVMI